MIVMAKEKAPSELALGKGANNKIQCDVITSYLHCQIGKMREAIDGIQRLARIASIDVKRNEISLQMLEDDFLRLFGQTKREPYLREYDRMYIVVSGIKVFCLCKRV